MKQRAVKEEKGNEGAGNVCCGKCKKIVDKVNEASQARWKTEGLYLWKSIHGN